MILILMGVSGAGKTTIGEAVASRLRWQFFDGDDFHSDAAKRKMHAGIALTDEDRRPWLAALSAKMRELIQSGVDAIFACSALKQQYRETLAVGPEVRFVFLQVSPEEVRRRMRARTGHFMSASLVDSQFATLEAPSAGENDVWRVNAEQSVDQVSTRIIELVRSVDRGR